MQWFTGIEDGGSYEYVKKKTVVPSHNDALSKTTQE